MAKRTTAGLLIWLFATCALAQSLSISSSPAVLAKAALGSEPGSASVAVWREGRIDVATVRNPGTQAAAAPTSEDLAPLYEIGSISKLFTGLLLAQAVEQGDLQLSDTLGTVLRGQVEFSSPEVAAITLQQLVTHGSCLPRQFGNLRGGDAIVAQITKATRSEMWAALAAQKIAKAGPCPALYSNYGMSVLAEILSVRYGNPGRIAHVAVDGSSLVVRSNGNIFRAYVPVGPDRFTRPAGGARMTFARGADGQVNALTLEQSGRLYQATRTDAPVVTEPLLPPGAAAIYVGRYVATRFLRSPVEFNIMETNNQLLIRSTSVDWQPVFAVPGQTDRFRYEVPAELQFERDASGAITGLVLLENGELRAARQPATP